MRAAPATRTTKTAMVPAPPLGAVLAALLLSTLFLTSALATVSSVYKVRPTPRHPTSAPSSAAATYEGGSPIYPPTYHDLGVDGSATVEPTSGQQHHYLVGREHNGSVKLYRAPLTVLVAQDADAAAADVSEDAVMDAASPSLPRQHEQQQEEEEGEDDDDDARGGKLDEELPEGRPAVDNDQDEDVQTTLVVVYSVAKDAAVLGHSSGDLDVALALAKDAQTPDTRLEAAAAAAENSTPGCTCLPGAVTDADAERDSESEPVLDPSNPNKCTNDRRLKMGTGALIAFLVAALVLL